VQQGAHGGLGQIGEVDPQHPIAAAQLDHCRRDCLPGAHGGQQEHQPGVQQLAQQPHRGHVQQRQVINQQYQSGRAGPLPDRAHRGVEDGHRVHFHCRPPHRHQMGERAQRHPGRRHRCGYPGDGVAPALRRQQALLGQPGLPNADRTADQEALAGAQRAYESIDLCTPAHQWPAARHMPPKRLIGHPPSLRVAG